MNVLKVLILQLVGLFISMGISAQTDNFLVHRTVKTAALSFLNIHDDYLSQMNYSGLGLRVEGEHIHLIPKSDQLWQWYTRSEYLVGFAINDALTASMYHMRTNQHLGLHRNYFFDFANLSTGLNAEYEAGFKYLSRNINNPLSVDMNIDLNLHASLRSSYYLFSKEIGVLVQAETPLLGAMFIPEFLDPYFNSFDFKKVILFSSLHNKTAYTLKISNEIPLNNFTAVVGLYTEKSKWEGNQLHFSYTEFGLQAALKFDYALFGGIKKMAPKNAINFKY